MEMSDSVEDFSESGTLILPQRRGRRYATVDEAIEAAGWFHHRLLILCGLMWAADAIEILCIAYVLPAAECELSLTSSDKGWLNATVFMGLMTGGCVGGIVGDFFGRKGVLFISMISNGLFGIASSFMPSFWPFLSLRFLSACGVGAALPVNMPYFAEFQPSKVRGRMVTFLASFFLVGNVIAAAFAWSVIPSSIVMYLGTFKYAPWRLFVALCGIPSALAGCLVLYFPESPRYLMTEGKNREALEILRYVWSVNNQRNHGGYLRLNENFPVDEIVGSKEARVERKSIVKTTLNHVKQLLCGSIKRNFWILFSIHFSIAFGYYGLMMWFPEIFNRLLKYRSLHPTVDDVGICDVRLPEEDVAPPTCSPLDPLVYANQMLLAIAPFPTNVWNILHMDKLGRKFFLVVSMVGAGASVFAVWLVRSQLENLLVSMAFSSVSNMGFNSLNCLATELFPTKLRSTAMALTAGALRIGAFLGNIAFGYFIDAYCVIPMVAVACLMMDSAPALLEPGRLWLVLLPTLRSLPPPESDTGTFLRPIVKKRRTIF
ncbi:unnamed protein product [Notodromas monacha]|uniref:Major facilitator superfamily (MFS) profile domain-containing protein n=1 Tax=Notodromas monacha TaxID=399045 RepID=A0A7R9BKU9_9CRUS|nr:unnamed protein product [Notodromas monacha]CAG0915845.1 unnamed protein product [Notodromas monacha]